MKVVKNKINRFLTRICSLLLGLLGFSNCDDNDVHIFSTGEEYGSPYADYKVSGYVQNTEKQGIEGIEIKYNRWEEEPTAITDKEGRFEFKTSDYLTELYITDIDGEQNGHYQNDTIDLKFTKEELIEEGEGWYMGKYEKKDLIITLKEVEKEEETVEEE